MKKGRIFKIFLFSAGLLGLFLLLIWIVFYLLTGTVIERKLEEQAASTSEAIISGLQEQLLLLENNALELSYSADVADMLLAKDPFSFYEAGGKLAGEKSPVAGLLRPADVVILFDNDGMFFRLRGSIGNTACKKSFSLAEKDRGAVFSFGSENRDYIAACEPVKDGQKTLGTLVFLVEENRIERMLKTYNRSEDIGVILLAGDRILCTDRPLQNTTLESIKSEAVFFSEKEIGLSGFRILVYSYRKGLNGLSAYFRVALPVTAVILLLTIAFFVKYMRDHMVEPIELMRERSLKYLLKKQISAHFTVNTLNVIRALIYKDDKETASDTCDELAALLRYANAGEDRIPLSEELYVIGQYVAIMRTRYPGMIEIDIPEEEGFEEIMIPRMLLQPVVENAIVHGLSGSKGKISIDVNLNNEDLYIKVSDNGKGMDEDKLAELIKDIRSADAPEVKESEELHHIALQNIERRIKTQCGEKYGIDISSRTGEGTCVTLHLPHIQAESAQTS